ncbi:MAG TPA: hypothetical protein VMM58_02365 [Bacteroidota bacterium]|nr:hypothetical protein [Bacteroidota bacterium]
MESIDNIKAQIKQALAEEIKARDVFPKKAILTSGMRVATTDAGTVYRFEIPESILVEPSFSVRCTIGVNTRFSFPAVIADVHHQFAFFLLPLDMGESIPELMCEWNPSEAADILLQRWDAIGESGLLHALVERNFSANTRPTTKEPIFPSTFTESQLNAVKKSMARKISIIVGERKQGKTGVAASLIFSSLKEGKRVLYLTPSSGGLYDCMHEVVSMNPAVAEESIAVFDSGSCLFPRLNIPSFGMRRGETASNNEGLKKLAALISAEHEYERIDAVVQKLAEKQQQIGEATGESDAMKAEVQRLQNASMLERMKQRINKADIDNAQTQLQNKLALVERLRQQVANLVKEQFKKESQLPIPLKERAAVEKLASTEVVMQATLPPAPGGVRCLASTVREALKFGAEKFGDFDVVCIDDAHALNLAEFFWCASHAKEQCMLLADITEQPPRSAAQVESAKSWLQKNYFLFFQQQESEERRFTVDVLPADSASELANPALPPPLLESCLAAAVDQTPVPQGTVGRVYFVNTSEHRAVSEQYLGKKKILPYNEVNGKKVVDCIKHALLNGSTTQEEILVVVPPSGQATYLRELLKSHQMNNVEIASLGAIRLCAKRTIIFDTTVAGLDFTLRILDEKKSGRVRVADTLNTLLSTVREDFYAIGDLSYFQTRYKDRIVTKLLEILSSKSESVGNILNAARRFDDAPPDVRKRILFGTAEEKQSADYKSKLDQAKGSGVDASKPASQQTIALAERKLKNDVRASILRVLAKREAINTVAQYLSSYPLYRTTVETEKYSSVLWELDCENENDFKNVMNMWNVLIYEASDAYKTSHPLAIKAKVDSKIAADIQQLYAYYHSDIESVVETGKHKLAQSVQQIFNDCIGRKPVTPGDWMKAYLVFLGRMEKYLDTVINQIRA